MIGSTRKHLQLRKYCCEDFSLIENYEKAINDNENMWVCHHRNEITMNLTPDELKKLGLYWNRPASELIFLTRSEHSKLHKNANHHFKGVPEESNPNYKKICPLLIYNLYSVQKMSAPEICKILNIVKSTLYKRLKKYNISLWSKENTASYK